MKKTIFIILCILSSFANAGRPMNELPMYGGIHNPKVGHDKGHSTSAAKLGWKYFYKGDLKTAIKRFNQSWMFDRNNSEAFWGFGLIMGRRASEENTEINLRESINYLEKADQLSKNNSRIIVDLAFSKTLLGYYLKESKKPLFKKHFDEADALYTKAQKLEENYPILYSNWSVLKFYEGDYSLAFVKLKQAKQFGYEADPNYERELNEKLEK